MDSWKQTLNVLKLSSGKGEFQFILVKGVDLVQ